MTTLDDLLVKHGGMNIEHAEVLESSAKVKSRGGGKFDETKVKRDGDGMFAKKSGIKDGEAKDAEWLKWENLNKKLLDIFLAAGDAFQGSIKAVMKKHGLKESDDLDNHPKALAEAKKVGAQVLNNYAENSGVSPSGDNRIEYRIGNGPKHNLIAGVKSSDGSFTLIPRKAPPATSNADDRRTPLGPRSNASTSSGTQGNFRFNPNATLDTSRVSDADDPDQEEEDSENWLERLLHEDPLTPFLEHHGIKGQKWGVRRSDSELGTIARFKNKLSRKKGDDEEEPTSKVSGGDSKPEGGGPKSGGSDHVAIDHERFVKTLSKNPEQMSDQELREATNRAQALQNYQRMFAPENKSQLQKDVESLQLQKQYRDLNTALNPPSVSALSKLVQKSQQGFDAYLKLDKALNGDLSKGVSRKLGLAPKPTEHEQAKAAADLAKWRKNAAADTKELNKLTAESEVKRLQANLVGVKYTPPSNPLLFGSTAGAARTVAAPRVPTSHRAPTALDRLRASNRKPSDDLPSLIDIYKTEAKNRQPDLLEQLKKGRHRK